jgi:hypothetical protein
MVDPVLVAWPFADFFASTIGFMIVMIAVVMAAGIASKSLSIAAAGGYTTFVFFASNVNGVRFVPELMYISIIVITLGIGFKFWRLEVGGEGGV